MAITSIDPTQLNIFLYLISFGIGSILLWISSKILGGRLGLISAFAITILSTILSRILPVLLPNINVFVSILAVFIARIFLISSFGGVGLIRAFFINILPSLAMVIIVFLLIGGLGFYSLS